MSKATSNPAEIQKLDRKKQVLVSLRQGVDLRTISEHLDLGEEYVRQIAQEEMQYLSLATQEIQEHFVAMTFARAEKIMSRIFPDFDLDPPTMPNTLDEKVLEKWRDDVKYWRRMVSESIKNWALVTRIQKEILQVKGVGEKDKPGGDTNVQVNNITITASGDLYQEALDSIHIDTFGETFPEMQVRLLAEGDMIQLPSEDRLNKIEKAIANIHVPPDPHETDNES